ncbi:MAG: SAM-dependent DNA methyltransferase [Erysipelotrichaceae bacterium]|nr:SAM-dependent DNA methyltransferase [Erysipelotrichaceae bacterium]
MITGSLKSKVDAIRQDFYNENKAQASDVVNQLTMLMFIKMLDDKQNDLEARASLIGVKPNQNDLTFKDGEYKNYETGEGEKRLKFTIPYSDLRWKNFKNLSPSNLAKRIRDYVVPFIMDKDNKAVGKFAEYSSEYAYGFTNKDRLLASVVDKLSDDEFNFVNTDLMGDVYEYICGSGISGQFRTPRHIIDMAVEMMKPKLGEKIIDPAMGTAGFIVEAAKYIQEHQKDELYNAENKETFNSKMFYGCDNDTTMARIGYMNCILHNINDPVITMDSLLEHDNAKDLLGKFDLVLQNPPFAGSLVEEATNNALLAITKTKKTELLFVALMLKLMKIGGRGMSIVPDGVLFGSDNAHINLRRELVDKQKLVGVISMPQGLFAAPAKKGSASKGAGVKTSFLVFERTDNGGTDNVWFYDMTNDGFTLDAKRTECEGSDIPDVVTTFNKLAQELSHYNELSEEEKTEQRKNKWFFVPKQLIIENGYDLTINKYKIVEKKAVVHRSTAEIFADIDALNAEGATIHKELKSLLDVEETR